MAQSADPHSYERNERSASTGLLVLLWRDKFAFCSAIFLLIVVLCAIFGPALFGEAASRIDLRNRNVPPFSLDRDWLLILGSDSLGRSIVARLIVGSSNTMMVAGAAVLCAFTVGSALGLVAGYVRGWPANLIMRAADVIMSFPSLLLALVVLYVLGVGIVNVILVLAITRVPLYLRTCRAEVLELRERMYVTAARVLGAPPRRLIWRHIAPMTVPTLITIATVDFAGVMLSESSLSFLGLGIQPPGITWGLMVAEGQAYLATAWWLAFWPGVMITATALALNLLASWLRLVTDPLNRWRLEIKPGRRPA